MKKIINTAAFFIIVGLVGSWECGACDFKTLLLYCGIILSVLFVFHTILIYNHELKRREKHKIKQRKLKLSRVKIS